MIRVARISWLRQRRGWHLRRGHGLGPLRDRDRTEARQWLKPALEKTIARIGLRLGTEAVRLVLPPPVVRVVFAAVKVLKMAREAEREMGREMER